MSPLRGCALFLPRTSGLRHWLKYAAAPRLADKPQRIVVDASSGTNPAVLSIIVFRKNTTRFAYREWNTMKKIVYGIIGLGFFGEKHAEVAAALPNVELRAVCTRRDARRRQIKRRLGVPDDYRDYHDLLADRGCERRHTR
jgi:hypothetical protein